MALLKLQENHRSGYINHDNPVEDQFRTRVHTVKEPHPAIVDLLQISDFFHATQTGRHVLDPALITHLNEQWRPETHTFNLPCGECTVTLEDVALIVDLPVDGRVVTGTTFHDWDDVCTRLLGVAPPRDQMKGAQVKLRWLQRTFVDLPDNASPEQIQRFCRAYILCLLGGLLMPNKSGNWVHLMYLVLLENFERVGRYNWGSICLATLYRELCRGFENGAKAIGGCLVLLQYWVWYRLPFIAPRPSRSLSYPLASR